MRFIPQTTFTSRHRDDMRMWCRPISLLYRYTSVVIKSNQNIFLSSKAMELSSCVTDDYDSYFVHRDVPLR
ncbi:hypothetical protein J6590_027767 [Homalodisca vitripennis]|nr:hypothetical protein J6590_027767 [Homalodisca vitripennis]